MIKKIWKRMAALASPDLSVPEPKVTKEMKDWLKKQFAGLTKDEIHEKYVLMANSCIWYGVTSTNKKRIK